MLLAVPDTITQPSPTSSASASPLPAPHLPIEIDTSDPPPYVRYEAISTSFTAWTRFRIRGQNILQLPDARLASQFQVPDTPRLYSGSTLTATPLGNLVVFGGMMSSHLISFNMLDIGLQPENQNSTIPMEIYETRRNPPSPRRYHGAACLDNGTVSLVIWGGEDMGHSTPSFSDTDLHVFSFGEYSDQYA